ncbi:MAG: PIG-L family deacetylase [Bacillota bacterium]|nr:PIG-L family deacetylase [Bacillota bacterium]
MTTATNGRKLRILGFGAHPDDLEISCGGTLAKYQQLGHQVIMGVACVGDKGHREIPPEELAKIRIEESNRAGAYLNAPVYNLGFKDGEILEQDLATRWKVVDLIRRADPDVIITHHPADYHADHVAVSRLAVDASFMVSVPHIRTEFPAIHKVPQIYFMDNYAGVNFTPSEYVDVTKTFSLKEQMLGEHLSQINWLKDHDNMDIMEFIRICGRFRGFQCGVGYAEGFVRYISSLRVTPERLLP